MALWQHYYKMQRDMHGVINPRMPTHRFLKEVGNLMAPLRGGAAKEFTWLSQRPEAWMKDVSLDVALDTVALYDALHHLYRQSRFQLRVGFDAMEELDYVFFDRNANWVISKIYRAKHGKEPSIDARIELMRDALSRHEEILEHTSAAIEESRMKGMEWPVIDRESLLGVWDHTNEPFPASEEGLSPAKRVKPARELTTRDLPTYERYGRDPTKLEVLSSLTVLGHFLNDNQRQIDKLLGKEQQIGRCR